MLKKILIFFCVVFCLVTLVGYTKNVVVDEQHMTKNIVHNESKKENVKLFDITINNFVENIAKIYDAPSLYDGKSYNIEGYFTKLEDDKLYYFISYDVCLGCDNENTYGQFIEVLNLNGVNLDNIYSDDFVKLSGVIKILSNSEGYIYPVISLQTIEKIN